MKLSEMSWDTCVEDTSYMTTLVMPLSQRRAARAWAALSVLPYIDA